MSSCGAKGARTPNHSLKADVPEGAAALARTLSVRFSNRRPSTLGRELSG